MSADPNHVLPAWQTLTDAPSLAGKSGRGTYTATVNLPPGWTGGHGAYLDLGQADDTAIVTVNGHDAGRIDQVDGGRRVDVGPFLVSGQNTIVVRVSTNLFNATGGAPQNYGLIGPVRLIPYGEATAFSTTGAHRHRRRHRAGDAVADARRPGGVRRVHPGRREGLQRARRRRT